EPGGTHASLWTISFLGGTSRQLRDTSFAAGVSPDYYGWGSGYGFGERDTSFAASVSPDGSLIAFTSEISFIGARDLWVMGANGEDPRKLVSLDANSAFQAITWSPDGQRIAYLKFHHPPGGFEAFLESLDLRTGQPVLIFSDPRLRDFCWLRDDRIIFSKGELPPNESEDNFWQIRVDLRNGAPTEKPQRLTNWAGFQLLDPTVSADGSILAFRKRTYYNSAYVAEIQANGARISTPRRLSLGEYNEYPTAWTRDSSALLLGSYRDGKWQILKQSLDQQSVEVLATPGTFSFPRLSSDGLWVLFSVFSENAIKRVSVFGGSPQVVLTTQGLMDLQCAPSPNNVCVFGEFSSDGKQLTFVSFDPVSGRGRELAKVDTDSRGHYGFNLSPDGSRLAFLKTGEDYIRILPLRGGVPSEVHP